MAIDSYARDLAAAALAAGGGGSSNYAKLNEDNTFEGDQTFNGSVVINGGIIENNIETELPSGELVVNKEYYLGELSQLTCNLPEGELGDYIFIKFESGETPTIITLNPEIGVGDIPEPIANLTYEMILTWNGEAWVFSYRGY